MNGVRLSNNSRQRCQGLRYKTFKESKIKCFGELTEFMFRT